jgi:hypothetical protein
MKTILKFNRLKQNTNSFAPVGSAPNAFILFAFAAFLLVFMGSCEHDLADIDAGSGTALLMDEEDMALEKKKAFPVPGPVEPLTTGLQGASGSTIGPGGALYIAEYASGRISRVDPETGDITTFASGFPTPVFDIGGVWDVAFIGGTAYALVTLVGPEIGGNPNDVVGIYRIDGPNGNFTVIADIGAFSLANPPNTAFFVPTGVQYSFQTYRGAFLVADGHHNRVLHVTLDGVITEFKTFGKPPLSERCPSRSRPGGGCHKPSRALRFARAL